MPVALEHGVHKNIVNKSNDDEALEEDNNGMDLDRIQSPSDVPHPKFII